MNLRHIFPALLAAASVSVAAGARDMELKSRTVQLNGDLTAQIMSAARNPDGHKISTVMKISNTGENTVFAAIIGKPTVVDLTEGFQFENQGVTGLAFCDTMPERLCAGIPDVRRAYRLWNF